MEGHMTQKTTTEAPGTIFALGQPSPASRQPVTLEVIPLLPMYGKDGQCLHSVGAWFYLGSQAGEMFMVRRCRDCHRWLVRGTTLLTENDLEAMIQNTLNLTEEDKNTIWEKYKKDNKMESIPVEDRPIDKNLDVVGTAQTVIDLDPNDPQYVKKVQASIKRLVHAEKYLLLTRLLRYVKDSHKFGIEVIEKKIETHKKMMSMSDDEVITW